MDITATSTKGLVSMEKPLLSEVPKSSKSNSLPEVTFESVLEKCIKTEENVTKPKQVGLSLDYLCSLSNRQ